MSTNYKNYAKHIALRKPFNPAAVKLIMALSRSGVLSAIEKAPPEERVKLLDDCIAFILKRIEPQKEE